MTKKSKEIQFNTSTTLKLALSSNKIERLQ